MVHADLQCSLVIILFGLCLGSCAEPREPSGAECQHDQQQRQLSVDVGPLVEMADAAALTLSLTNLTDVAHENACVSVRVEAYDAKDFAHEHRLAVSERWISAGSAARQRVNFSRPVSQLSGTEVAFQLSVIGPNLAITQYLEQPLRMGESTQLPEESVACSPAPVKRALELSDSSGPYEEGATAPLRFGLQGAYMLTPELSLEAVRTDPDSVCAAVRLSNELTGPAGETFASQFVLRVTLRQDEGRLGSLALMNALDANPSWLFESALNLRAQVVGSGWYSERELNLRLTKGQ